jgi:hypothetical protein
MSLNGRTQEKLKKKDLWNVAPCTLSDRDKYSMDTSPPFSEREREREAGGAAKAFVTNLPDYTVSHSTKT